MLLPMRKGTMAWYWSTRQVLPLCVRDRPQVPGVIDPSESNYGARLPSGPKSATLSHGSLPLGISDVLFSEVPSEPEPTTPMLRDDHWGLFRR